MAANDITRTLANVARRELPALTKPVYNGLSVADIEGQSQFVRGAKSSLLNSDAAMFSTEGLEAEAMRDAATAKAAYANADAASAQAARTAPRVQSLRDVNGVEDFADFVAGGAPQAITSTLPVLGGALAARLVGAAGVNRLIDAGIKAPASVARAQQVLPFVGGAIPAYNMEREELVGSLARDPEARARQTPQEILDMGRNKALMTTALETVGPGMVVNKLFGKAARGSVLKSGALASVGEAGTEAAQQGIGDAYSSYAKTGNVEIDPYSIADAAVLGAAGSPVLSAPSMAATGVANLVGSAADAGKPVFQQAKDYVTGAGKDTVVTGFNAAKDRVNGTTAEDVGVEVGIAASTAADMYNDMKGYLKNRAIKGVNDDLDAIVTPQKTPPGTTDAQAWLNGDDAMRNATASKIAAEYLTDPAAPEFLKVAAKKMLNDAANPTAWTEFGGIAREHAVRTKWNNAADNVTQSFENLGIKVGKAASDLKAGFEEGRRMNAQSLPEFADDALAAGQQNMADPFDKLVTEALVRNARLTAVDEASASKLNQMLPAIKQYILNNYTDKSGNVSVPEGLEQIYKDPAAMLQEVQSLMYREGLVAEANQRKEITQILKYRAKTRADTLDVIAGTIRPSAEVEFNITRAQYPEILERVRRMVLKGTYDEQALKTLFGNNTQYVVETVKKAITSEKFVKNPKDQVRATDTSDGDLGDDAEATRENLGGMTDEFDPNTVGDENIIKFEGPFNMDVEGSRDGHAKYMAKGMNEAKGTSAQDIGAVDKLREKYIDDPLTFDRELRSLINDSKDLLDVSKGEGADPVNVLNKRLRYVKLTDDTVKADPMDIAGEEFDNLSGELDKSTNVWAMAAGEKNKYATVELGRIWFRRAGESRQTDEETAETVLLRPGKKEAEFNTSVGRIIKRMRDSMKTIGGNDSYGAKAQREMLMQGISSMLNSVDRNGHPALKREIGYTRGGKITWLEKGEQLPMDLKLFDGDVKESLGLTTMADRAKRQKKQWKAKIDGKMKELPLPKRATDTITRADFPLMQLHELSGEYADTKDKLDRAKEKLTWQTGSARDTTKEVVAALEDKMEALGAEAATRIDSKGISPLGHSESKYSDSKFVAREFGTFTAVSDSKTRQVGKNEFAILPKDEAELYQEAAENEFESTERSFDELTGEELHPRESNKRIEPAEKQNMRYADSWTDIYTDGTFSVLGTGLQQKILESTVASLPAALKTFASAIKVMSSSAIGGSAGRANPDGSISIAKEALHTLLSWAPSYTQKDANFIRIAHEAGHQMDRAAEREYSAELKTTFDEARALHAGKSSDTMKQWLSVVFDPKYYGASDPQKQQRELFAQLTALHAHNPNLLKTEFPRGYKYMEKAYEHATKRIESARAEKVSGGRYEARGRIGQNNQANVARGKEEAERVSERQVKSNSQAQDFTKEPMTEAEKAKVVADVTRRLGPQIKVEFAKIWAKDSDGVGHEISGDWVAGTIRIALSANNPDQIGAHESMHEFFNNLMQSKDKSVAKVKQILLNSANSPAVLRQIEVLLDKHPAALAQIKEGTKNFAEERLAYAFQFWQAGLLNIGPETKTTFQKVANFLRAVFGMLTDDQKAERILEAFDKGQLTTKDAVVTVLANNVEYMERKRQAAAKVLSPITGAISKLLMPSQEALMNSGNPSLVAISNMFKQPTGQAVAETMYEAKQRNTNYYMNLYRKIIAGATEGELKLAAEYLHAGKPPQGGKAKELYVAIREMFDDMHEYLRDDAKVMRWEADENGKKDANGKTEGKWVPMGKIKDNYMPRAYDVAVITKDPEAFIQDLLRVHLKELTAIADEANLEADSKAKVPDDYASGVEQEARKEGKHKTLTPEDIATAITNRILNSYGQVELEESESKVGYQPYMRSVNKRILTWLDTDALNKYMSKDLNDIMQTYVVQAVKRAEYVRSFGNGGEKLETLMNEAYKFEVNKEREANPDMSQEDAEVQALKNLEPAGKAIMALEGTLGYDIDPRLRNANGLVVAYENFRLLSTAIFSQLIDPLGIVVRGGSVKTAMGAYSRGIKEVIAAYKGEALNDDASALAEYIGTVEAAGYLATFGQQTSSMYMSKAARKLNDGLFTYNGMEGFNRAARVQATTAAIEFLKHHAKLPVEASQAYLEELGVTPAELEVDADGNLNYTSPKVRAAINRWVNGAILRPNAAHRPTWMSDPRYMVFGHMKQFSYTFHDTIMKRVMHDAKVHGNLGPLGVLLTFAPVMIAADIGKAILLGSNPTWSHDVGSAFGHGASRAGFAGMYQPVIDATIGTHGLMSLGGPAVEQVADMFVDPIGQTVENALPGANVLHIIDPAPKGVAA